MNAIWIGHKLVRFGSVACEQRGNEHSITCTESGSRMAWRKRVGCICAATLTRPARTVDRRPEKNGSEDRWRKALLETESN
jgi:hypothetical protein